VRRSVYTGSRSLSGRGARVGLLEPLADEAFMPGRMDQAELFSAVYRKLSRSVFGYLRARGVEDPEAVTQDVFLALYTRMGTLHGGIEGVKTLVFSIAHARAVDHHRRRGRVPASTPYDPAPTSGPWHRLKRLPSPEPAFRNCWKPCRMTTARS
jgi:DNA-directed RNA polymerase specialized sigma24 family protein